MVKISRIIINNDDFKFYDMDGNLIDTENSYLDANLDLSSYEGKSLRGLPNISGWLILPNHIDYDWSQLSKEYKGICVTGRWVKTKAEFDNWWKTEKLKKVLLD